MHTLFTDSAWQDLPGTREERDDDDDYENMAPSYKDLPPKPACARHHDGGSSHAFALPLKVSQSSGKSVLGMTSGSVAPPRPPKQGKKTENPRRPCKPLKITGLDLTPVTCTSQQGISLEHPPCQPSQATTPVPWLSQKSWGSECYQKERLMFSLVVVSLLLSCTGLAVTLIKYQKVVEELRILTFQQVAWQANVTGIAGLAGLKKDIDRIRADTNQSLVELRGLLDCTRVTCPEGWLLFEGKCYYFSTSTKSWDEARKFCQENYSHLVIISSIAEQNFVSKAHRSPRVHWLGLSDRDHEGEWKWLDGSPITLSFWDPEEPNNNYDEDCASMNKGGSWNDLSCNKATYWICERKCSC